MVAHRASTLLSILPNALETGFSEVFPEHESLKVRSADVDLLKRTKLGPQTFDSDLVIEGEDTEAQFLLAGPETQVADRESRLQILRESWDRTNARQHIDDSEWIAGLAQHLTHIVDLRVARVERWLKSNTQRFRAGDSNIDELRRAFDSAIIDLRASIQLCGSRCAACQLFCAQSRMHEGSHDCLTSHECIHDCTFCESDYLYDNRIPMGPCGQM
jgi:hypothetical protein